MGITYKDIAEAANVSTATVSHVLRKTRHVRPEIRQKVLKAAESLDYVPNRVASGLRQQSTRSIGFITAQLTNPVYAEMAVAAENVLQEHGYSVMISNTFNDIEREEAYVKAMAEHRVDGLLLTSIQMESLTWRWLIKYKLPFVLLNRRFTGFDAPFVGVDNGSGMYDIVDYLISLGHRRIGFIGGFSHSSAARDRYLGYVKAMHSHNLGIDPALYFEGRYDIQSGVEGAACLLALPSDCRPTAIAAVNDLSAFGVLAWASEHGVEVPEELSVTGFGNSELSGLHFIGLTTADQPHKTMGGVAADMLSKIIDGVPLAAKSIILPCQMVTRGSVARPGGTNATQ